MSYHLTLLPTADSVRDGQEIRTVETHRYPASYSRAISTQQRIVDAILSEDFLLVLNS
jgi:hypothetical protein